MNTLKSFLQQEIQDIKNNGLYKEERIITSQQQSLIKVKTNQEVLNLCANNYLGLSNHPKLIKASIDGIKRYGFGLSSVRFICGTQSIHTELEKKIALFLNKDDAILYTSCFQNN